MNVYEVRLLFVGFFSWYVKECKRIVELFCSGFMIFVFWG